MCFLPVDSDGLYAEQMPLELVDVHCLPSSTKKMDRDDRRAS